MANLSLPALETPTVSTMEPEFEFTDEQWNLIADLFLETPVGPKGGRPCVASRPCVEGILWTLRTGAPWKHLPKHFPSPATCWRRLKMWTENGIWEKAWARLLRRLDRQGRIDHEESFADGTFASAKKGVKMLARPSEARERSSWFSPMAVGFHSQSIRLAPVLAK